MELRFIIFEKIYRGMLSMISCRIRETEEGGVSS